MSQNENNTHASKAADNNLNERIREIVKDDQWKKASTSDKIMERLREKCIFLRDNYFHSFRHTSTITINPESEFVKFKLDAQDLIEDYVKLYANSFGPFNPEEYFKEDTFRVLWLLKESYMEIGDLDKYKVSRKNPYLGGHNQAEEYKEVELNKNVKFGNPTIDNLLSITRKVLLSSAKIGSEITTEKVMNHICILEVNHFPGLAFNGTKSSNNDIIEIWNKLNHRLINKLVIFYDPKLVMGPRNILNHFVTSYEKPQEGVYEIYYDEKNIYKEFFNWARRNKLSDWPNAKHFIFSSSKDLSTLNENDTYLPNEIIETNNAQIVLEGDTEENQEMRSELKAEETGENKGEDWRWISAAKTFISKNENDSIWWVAIYHPSYRIMNEEVVIGRLADFVSKLLNETR